MTLICGTDFSTHAEQAAQASGVLAGTLELPLKLVHVFEDSPPLLSAPLPESAYDAARARLRSQAEALATEYGVAVEPVAVHGAPHDVLIELAREARASLLVVAALGTKRRQQWLLGSVAERVVQCATVPVLVVRDASRIAAAARGQRPLVVTVGVDLGPTSRAALGWVERLRRSLRCNVRVVQIAWPVAEYQRLDTSPPTPFGELGPEIRQILERDLRAWVGPLADQAETTLEVSAGWGRVDADLTSLAAAAGSDLLVVGTHQHSAVARLWQGSVSRGVIHYATSNVVCVPLSAMPEATLPVARFRTVLIPTDFSPLANHAIAAGYRLLGSGGVAYLVHVVPPERAAEVPLLAEQLRSLVPPGAAGRGIASEVMVIEEQEPHIGIWHAAGRLGVDAVCMGTHGRSGASQMVLGSQAQGVLRRVRQPVMLVRGEG